MLGNILLGIAVAFATLVVFMSSDYTLRAPPRHGLRRRVVRDAVHPPAYLGLPMDQDADAPDGAAQDDEQMNRFHECRMGETPNPGNL